MEDSFFLDFYKGEYPKSAGIRMGVAASSMETELEERSRIKSIIYTLTRVPGASVDIY